MTGHSSSLVEEKEEEEVGIIVEMGPVVDRGAGVGV